MPGRLGKVPCQVRYRLVDAPQGVSNGLKGTERRISAPDGKVRKTKVGEARADWQR